MTRRNPRRPSSFFLVSLPALLVGVVAAISAGDSRPAYALNSNLVWRCEVGLVVFVILYVVTLLLYLAWQGRAPKQLGGGPATMETTPQTVDGSPEFTMDLSPEDEQDDEERLPPSGT